jgi:hypothetical protein
MMRAIVTTGLLVLSALGASAKDAPTSAPAPSLPKQETVRAMRRVMISEGVAKIGAGSMLGVASDAVYGVLKAGAGDQFSEQSLRQSMQIDVSRDQDPVAVVVRVDLRAFPELTPKRAAEAADAAVQAIDSLYTATERDPMERYALELKQLQMRRDQTRHEIEEIGAEQREITDTIRKEAALADASPEAVHAIAQKLATEYEAAQLDIKAKSARHDALAEAIAKLSHEAEAKANDDPVAAELAKVVELREKEVERKKEMYGQKALARAEVDEAVGAVAEARARLMERKMAAAAAGGGEAVTAWNRELLSLSIDLAELRARTEALDARLKQVTQALSALDRRPSPASLQQRIDDATKQLREVENQINEAGNSLRPENRARLTVIESTDEPVTPASQMPTPKQ